MNGNKKGFLPYYLMIYTTIKMIIIIIDCFSLHYTHYQAISFLTGLTRFNCFKYLCKKSYYIYISIGFIIEGILLILYRKISMYSNIRIMLELGMFSFNIASMIYLYPYYLFTKDKTI